MRHNPNHTEILCAHKGRMFWACEDCTYQEPAKQGELKQPEETRQFQLRLVAA